ncbi:PREDICTED: nephrin-like [Branchiostoma belcheri]|uniref:Nephrin-like n=1 Tax=Branchiostoma belcheri TaxID=7741 RepID=A0A6P5AXF5_BRABE|nr:PREDICTED: nephrin-like [Branchiostoma belcheri]
MGCSVRWQWWRFQAFSILALFLTVHCQQYFITEPEDTQVPAGNTVLLKCKVGRKTGEVQWLKDGFLLGSDRDLPGFPRYRVVGDSSAGQYSLLIENANLNDEAGFQCQLGPPNPIGSRTARVTVLLPPDDPSIEGYNTGVDIPMTPSQGLQLTCRCNNGKPAANLTWYRNGEEITEGVSYSRENTGTEKRQNATSVLQLEPTADDNRARYECRAGHAAFDATKNVSVTLSVGSPPGNPVITGIEAKVGDLLQITCRSEGGDPLPDLVWYKNDQRIDDSYHSRSNQTFNQLLHTVVASDNNAEFSCQASNGVTPTPLKTSVTLTVKYPPGQPVITGFETQSVKKVGDILQITCTSEGGNPLTDLVWYKNDQRIDSCSRTVGNQMFNQLVHIVVASDNNAEFSCLALNNVTSTPLRTSVTLTVETNEDTSWTNSLWSWLVGPET